MGHTYNLADSINNNGTLNKHTIKEICMNMSMRTQATAKTKSADKHKTVSVLFSPDRSIFGVYKSEKKASKIADDMRKKEMIPLTMELHELK